MSVETKRSALKLFEEVQAAFPHLVMEMDPADPHVDISLTIPQQAGLAFDVHLNLQNDDELYLGVGAFWCSWFPSSKPEVVQKYYDAVVGILAGRHRIVEYFRWGRTLGADLQVTCGNGWKTLARSRGAMLPVSWFSEKRILTNNLVL